VTYRIAAIGGDGIGPEVLAEGVKALEAVAGGGLRFTFETAEVGAALHARTGEDLPREAVALCRGADAILFGAAGLPDVRFPFGDILSNIGGTATTTAVGDAVAHAV
jgi:isocitrate/isopropylmalate dehydrogenase